MTLLLLLNLSCHSQDLKVVADLPNLLREASGAQKTIGSDLIWMINDAGNSPELFGLNKKGKIKKVIKIKSENNDWEDLASDDKGNLYIGDFGNNKNNRTDLTILKIKKEDLSSSKPVDAEMISFYYPDQDKFPPKKKKRVFDCESFFFLNDSLYLFTKSRVDDYYGKTNLYKIPAEPGNYKALKIGSYKASCNEFTCWITSADISPDRSKVVLLSPSGLLVFNNFKNDDFFAGDISEYEFDFITQKESVFFKNNRTLYITDELAFGIGGNLYEFKID
ncbi:MAG: hypothetical protein HKO81_09290 [Flavobacteriaceae bacterium]|nr:hypothetical protein [Flavobacteriaceae bacterium]